MERAHPESTPLALDSDMMVVASQLVRPHCEWDQPAVTADPTRPGLWHHRLLETYGKPVAPLPRVDQKEVNLTHPQQFTIIEALFQLGKAQAYEMSLHLFLRRQLDTTVKASYCFWENKYIIIKP